MKTSVAIAACLALAACGAPHPVPPDETDAGTADSGAELIPCDGRCGAAEKCLADAGVCCAPQCAGKSCGPDGCGGTCGTCGAGTCDQALGACIEDCFPARQNANLGPSIVTRGASAPGGLTCDEANAKDLDGQYAGIGYTGTSAMILQGKRVTACLVGDFGRQCALTPKVGVGFSFKMSATACGDPGGTQCDVPSLCGALPGASALLFVAADLTDVRFLGSSGACGSGANLWTLSPVTSLADAATLKSARYLLLCRPFDGCGASDANLLADAMYLTYRN